jgi:alanine racemase
MHNLTRQAFEDGWHSVAEIDLSAIRHNLNTLREMAGKTVMQMAVVKADAYGHGAVPVAHFCSDFIEWFGVYQAREAVALREAGITRPILVFGTPTRETVSLYGKYNLTATISHMDHFDLLPGGCSYHLKFDTGMGRVGFQSFQADEVAGKVVSNRHLIYGGLMTHFATAEDSDTRVFDMQMASFRSIVAKLGNGVLIHAANSAANLHRSDVAFDMLRSGVGMYGFDPTGDWNPALRPAMRWISRMAQVRYMQKGQGVSYSHSWKLPENGWIGVVPVGYADGLNRSLTNRISLSTADRIVRQVGNVTMDQVMVYLGDTPVESGEEVLILGGTEQHSVYEWARLLHTIPYEVTCAIGNRVRRVHLTAGESF